MNNIFEEHEYQRRVISWFLVTAIWSAFMWHICNNGLSNENQIVDIVILLLLPLAITLLLFLLKLSDRIDKNYKSYYTVKGYKGVEFSLNDGTKIFIGSANAEEIHTLPRVV